MAKLTLEEPDVLDGEKVILPPESVVQVRVLEVREAERGPNAKGEFWQVLDFKFEIVGAPEQYKGAIGDWIWGNVSARFTTHPDNKLRQWVQALFGLDLEPGFELDTEVLVGRKARAVISNYKKRDGNVGQGVAGLLPLDGGTAAPAAPVDDDEELPF
jgi:hypothetical protein